MAAAARKPVPLQCIPRKRLTESRSGYFVSDLSLSLSGDIALSGYKKSGETFISLYSGVGSDFNVDPKLFYSKHFNAYKKDHFRLTSFLTEDAEKIVTCIGNKAEVIDTKNDNTVFQTHTEDDGIKCLVIGEGKIFLFLYFPARVIIFNTLFQEKKVVTLNCVKSRDCFWDVAIVKDKLYLCVDYRVIVYNYKTGIVLQEYKYSSKWISSLDTDSITVSEELGLTVVAWNTDLVLLYPIDEKKSVASFKDDFAVSKIRILEKERMMLTVDPHCVVTAYYLGDLLTYIAVKETLVSLLKKEEVGKLAKILAVSMRDSYSIFRPKLSTWAFLTECEAKMLIQESDVATFEDALTKVNPSHCSVLKIYQKIHRDFKEGPNSEDLSEDLKHIQCREKERREQRGKIEGRVRGYVKDDPVEVFDSDTNSPGLQSIKGFGSFQFAISSIMTRDIVRSLALVLEFSPVESEQVEEDSIKFIRLLSSKGFISSTNVSPLVTALHQIDQHGVADSVETIFLKRMAQYEDD